MTLLSELYCLRNSIIKKSVQDYLPLGNFQNKIQIHVYSNSGRKHIIHVLSWISHHTVFNQTSLVIFDLFSPAKWKIWFLFHMKKMSWLTWKKLNDQPAKTLVSHFILPQYNILRKSSIAMWQISLIYP